LEDNEMILQGAGRLVKRSSCVWVCVFNKRKAVSNWKKVRILHTKDILFNVP
jgi:hypothetical protein